MPCYSFEPPGLKDSSPQVKGERDAIEKITAVSTAEALHTVAPHGTVAVDNRARPFSAMSFSPS